MTGCLTRPIAPQDTRTTSTVVERLGQRVDKIDLLLTIDNSGSMKDKQDILALAVPNLVKRLVNPRCIDPLDPLKTSQPALPSDRCDAGMEREFAPVTDIHIGIISTSLGSHGAEGSGACAGEKAHFSNNDGARLVARSHPDDRDPSDNTPPTYANRGFLAWDPEQRLDPAGEAVLEDGSAGLLPTLKTMVQGVGDVGCGYEAQLESWYRFLAEPEPYKTITVERGIAVLNEVDDVLLAQRKAFLRPDSLLAIIMLSDENDCSIRDGGTAYQVALNQPRDAEGRPFTWRMYKPRKECTDKGLDDPCCKSCGSPRGQCPLDEETCGPEDAPARLTELQDPINLRCFDQKRRFGVDLLQPIDRYTRALTLRQVPDRQGDLVDNPIFSDLDPDDANSNVRPPELVFFAGIIGVPWQDIARQDDAGKPDLLRGKDSDGNAVGGFKSAAELDLPVAGLSSTWEVILGTPETYTPPKDPHMIEWDQPRQGRNPITGTEIALPESPDDANVINGHEWNPRPKFGDLQYACVFPLPKVDPVTGQAIVTKGEDCKKDDSGEDRNNPLCEDDESGVDTEVQVKAKAYPGLRQLQLIRDLGDQGIVGSVCPAQLEEPDALDFGYQPAMGAIVDRLKTRLGGQCLPRALQPTEEGRVTCLVLEARNVPDGQCGCDELTARREVADENFGAKQMVLKDPASATNGWNCVCEVEQLSDPEELTACQNTVPPAPVEVGGEKVHGWCYVDPRLGFGDERVVAQCPSTERRQVRFTGEGQSLDGATQFVICSGDSSHE